VVKENEDGGLEFLAATSHRVEELELYQLQVETGPCVECVRTDEHVVATQLDDVRVRWPELGEPFRRAGFVGVHAAPLHWHGRAIGALNLFWTDDRDLDGQGAGLAQTFADVATVAIVSTGGVPVTQVLRRTRAALRERAVIEQAKGVLAHRENLDMAGAFEHLLEMAGRNGNDLRITAADVVRQAARQRRP
jgi:hypothetical protein